jgi:hypothetical protein
VIIKIPVDSIAPMAWFTEGTERNHIFSYLDMSCKKLILFVVLCILTIKVLNQPFPLREDVCRGGKLLVLLVGAVDVAILRIGLTKKSLDLSIDFKNRRIIEVTFPGGFLGVLG